MSLDKTRSFYKFTHLPETVTFLDTQAVLSNQTELGAIYRAGSLRIYFADMKKTGKNPGFA